MADLILVYCSGSGLPGVLLDDMTMQCPMCGQEMESRPDAASDGVVPDHRRPREEGPCG